jgi:hypothetical protein
MLDILFVLGCFLVWFSVGAITVVKHRAKNGKKANMLAPGIMMVIAIALIAAPKVFG